MPITPAALKSELTTDPKRLGYAQAWADGTDWQLVDLLNAPMTGGAAVLVPRGLVDSYAVISCVTPADWAAAPTSQSWLTFLVNGPVVDLGNANVRQSLAAMFPAGSATRAALVALATRPASRAEELFGQSVAPADIAAARKA